MPAIDFQFVLSGDRRIENKIRRMKDNFKDFGRGLNIALQRGKTKDSFAYLGKTGANLTKVLGGVKNIAGLAGKAIGVLGGAVAGMIVGVVTAAAAWEAFKKGLRVYINLLKVGVTEVGKLESAVTALNVAQKNLETRYGKANVYKGHIDDMNELYDTSIHTEEQITKAAANLKRINLNEDQFGKALQYAADLAAVDQTGRGIEFQAKWIQKLLAQPGNDPEGLAARLLGGVDKQLEARIDALVAAGRIDLAREMRLDQLSFAMKQAAANARTFEGRIARIKRAILQAALEIGKGFKEGFGDSLKGITEVFETKTFIQGLQEIGRWTGQIAAKLMKFVEVIARYIEEFVRLKAEYEEWFGGKNDEENVGRFLEGGGKKLDQSGTLDSLKEFERTRSKQINEYWDRYHDVGKERANALKRYELNRIADIHAQHQKNTKERLKMEMEANKRLHAIKRRDPRLEFVQVMREFHQDLVTGSMQFTAREIRAVENQIISRYNKRLGVTAARGLIGRLKGDTTQEKGALERLIGLYKAERIDTQYFQDSMQQLVKNAKARYEYERRTTEERNSILKQTLGPAAEALKTWERAQQLGIRGRDLERLRLSLMDSLQVEKEQKKLFKSAAMTDPAEAYRQMQMGILNQETPETKAINNQTAWQKIAHRESMDAYKKLEKAGKITSRP
jgi:hypothetical protein